LLFIFKHHEIANRRYASQSIGLKKRVLISKDAERPWDQKYL